MMASMDQHVRQYQLPHLVGQSMEDAVLTHNFVAQCAMDADEAVPVAEGRVVLPGVHLPGHQHILPAQLLLERMQCVA